MRRSLALLSFFAVLLSLTALRHDIAARAQQIPAEEALRSAGDRPIDIKHLRLDLKIDLPNKTAEGEATLTFRALRDLSEIRLDAVEFTVAKVTLTRDKEAVPTRFAHDGKNLLVTVPGGLKADEPGKLVVAYKVRDSRAGLHFFAPTKANPDVPQAHAGSLAREVG
jgi:aminopeptidase N